MCRYYVDRYMPAFHYLEHLLRFLIECIDNGYYTLKRCRKICLIEDSCNRYIYIQKERELCVIVWQDCVIPILWCSSF